MAYSLEHNPTNPNAIPLYNDSIFKFWNWFDTVWICDDWVTWHKANVKQYGLQEANRKFMEHWDNLSLASTAIDCRSFNNDFRDYIKKVGLYDAVYKGIGLIAKPIGIVNDVGGAAVDTLTNTAKLFKVLIPLLICIAAAIAIIYVLKKGKIVK